MPLLQGINEQVLKHYCISSGGYLKLIPKDVEIYYVNRMANPPYMDTNMQCMMGSKNNDGIWKLQSGRFGQLYFHQKGTGGVDICLSDSPDYALYCSILHSITFGIPLDCQSVGVPNPYSGFPSWSHASSSGSLYILSHKYVMVRRPRCLSENVPTFWSKRRGIFFIRLDVLSYTISVHPLLHEYPRMEWLRIRHSNFLSVRHYDASDKVKDTFFCFFRHVLFCYASSRYCNGDIPVCFLKLFLLNYFNVSCLEAILGSFLLM